MIARVGARGARVIVALLGRRAAEHDYGGVAVLLDTAVESRLPGLGADLVYRRFAHIVPVGLGYLFNIVACAAQPVNAAGGIGSRRRNCGIGVAHRLVHVETGGLERVVEAYVLAGLFGGTYVHAVYGVIGRAAVTHEGDLFGACKGKRAAAVFEEHAALFGKAGAHIDVRLNERVGIGRAVAVKIFFVGSEAVVIAAARRCGGLGVQKVIYLVGIGLEHAARGTARRYNKRKRDGYYPARLAHRV